jgi:hypothetical protein
LLVRTGVKRVSAALEVEPISKAAGDVDQALTKKVRDLFGCIARVVYSQSHERFETAVKERLFEQLHRLQVQIVPVLELRITLAGATRTAAGDYAPLGDHLLVRDTAPSHVDYLAMEIRRILRLPQGQVAPISALLRSTNMKDAEGFLRVTHVSQLPAHEQALIDGLVSGQPQVVVEVEGDTDPEDDHSQPEVTAAEDDRTRDGDATIPSPYTDEAVASPPRDTPKSTSPGAFPIAAPSPAPSASTVSSQELGPTRQTSSSGPESTPREIVATGPRDSVPSDPIWATGSAAKRGVASQRTSPGTGNGEPLNGAGNAANSLRFEPTTQFPHRTPGDAEGSIRPREVAGTKRPSKRTKSGRLLSYTEAAKRGDTTQDDEDESNPEVLRRKAAVEKAGVDHFLATATGQWRDVEVMPPNNPGFDIRATARDGRVEFIEVKGQSGAWTEVGVALTTREMLKAEEERERYWLCVVEYATDESKRQLYLVNNPFGLVDQFRFDKGWKGAATVFAARPTHPREGLLVTIAGEGKARILAVKGNARLAKIDYQLVTDGQKRFNKLFQPNTMILSVD